MLTSNDLLQIEKIVEKTVDRIVMKRIEASERKIINKINLVISFLDNEVASLKNRVERIEQHLKLN